MRLILVSGKGFLSASQDIIQFRFPTLLLADSNNTVIPLYLDNILQEYSIGIILFLQVFRIYCPYITTNLRL